MIMRCRGKLAQIALVVLGASLLAGWSSDNGGKKSATDTSNKRAALARFEPGPCPQTPEPVPGFDKASCGVLTVPENRQNNNGRTIRLTVVRVPAAVPHTPPLEPILFIAGGPGNSALLDAHYVTDPGVEVQRDHEVIFMSARGTWGSTPFLTCPEVDDFEKAFPGLTYGSDAAREGRVRAVHECHDRLVAQNEGIDLSAYNTTEAATDYAVLRTVLGIKEWHVLGHSYGTYLAQELIRTHPDGIRSVFLEGIAPPAQDSPEYWAWDSFKESLDNIFRACGEQPPCAARYPQLGVQLNELATTLEASPFRTTAKGPNGQPVDVVLDGGALMAALHRSAFNPAGVPLMIDEAAKGNPQKLAQLWADKSAPPPPSARGTFSHGFHYSVVCSESIADTTASEELTKSKQLFPGFPDSLLRSGPQFPFYRDVCGAWPVRKAPAAVRQPVTSASGR
jgi:pimeloyl-ACP methyl ester carboxylesterase